MLDLEKELSMRKKAEQSLEESEARFRLSFENANIGMCLVGLEGRFLTVNKKMCDIFGYNREELENMTVSDITHPEDLDISLTFIQRAVSGEVENTAFDKKYLHKHGHTLWGKVASSIVRDIKGVPQYFITHIQDISEQKQSEKALKASEEKYRLVVENAPPIDRRRHYSFMASRLKSVAGEN
jgi:PAS domain S-box-containing protein